MTFTYRTAATFALVLHCSTLVSSFSPLFPSGNDRVAHYTFPHTLAGEDAWTDRIVVLHVYMTWRTEHGRYYMKGFGFTDAAAARGKLGPQAKQSAASEAHQPQLHFEDGNGNTFHIHQTAWTVSHRPFDLQYVFDEDPGTLKLVLGGEEGLHYHLSLSPLSAETARYHDPTDTQHCMANVLSTFHPATQPHLAVAALLLHLQYHSKIGVHQTLMYVTSQFLPALYGSHEVRALIASGSLHLIPWHDFPEWTGNEYWSQNLQYNHGILWTWGTGCYASLTDLDEYLTYDTMQTQSVVSVLHTFGNFSRVELVRNQMICAACKPDEFHTWFGTHSESHPIDLYPMKGIVDPDLFGKHIVHPHWVYGWNVHRGDDFPWSPPPVKGGDTMWLRHMANMFETRLTPPAAQAI